MVTETIISVKTGEAVKNIKELKENIKVYKASLDELEFGSAQYQDRLKEITAAQQMLRDAMHATNTSFADLSAAVSENTVQFDKNNQIVTMEGVSYNSLVNTLHDLKEAWRGTTDEQKRAKLGEQINAVNNQLKTMDASVGNYQRNVGMYGTTLQHLTNSFASMGKGAAGIVAPLKGVTTGLKAMSATPAIAILGVLAGILDEVMKALKSNEEGTQAMTAAMAPFQAILDVVTKGLQALGKGIVWVVEKMAAFTQSIFKNNEATEKRIALAQKEKQLTEQSRKTLIANAEAERDIAELRAKASDKATYSAKERMEFLQQAGDLEREIAQRAFEDAKLQYEIIHQRNSLTKSSTEDLQKEAEAYAAMVKAETSYYNQIRTINAGITKARREETAALNEENKAKEEARKAELESYKALLQQEIELAEKGSQERLAKQKELLKKEYDAAVQNAKDKITNAETLNRTLLALQKKYSKDVSNLERDNVKERQSETYQALENLANSYAKGSVQQLKVLRDLAKKQYEEITREAGESAAAYEKRLLEGAQKFADADRALTDAIRKEKVDQSAILLKETAATQESILQVAMLNAQTLVQQIEKEGRRGNETETQFRLRLAEAREAERKATADYLDELDRLDHVRIENEMNTLQEGSLAYLSKTVELKKFELDAIHRLEGESNEDFRARQLAAQKEYYDAQKALAQGYVTTMTTVTAAVSGLFGSLADMYESNTTATKREQEKAKNLRLAGAYIDMFSGVVTAIAQAQSLGPILGPIMAATNSAAVIAAGVANINKIKSTQISTTSAPATSDAEVPAVVDAPTVTPQVQQVQNITGNTEEERLNRMADGQRVYILSSDLEADANARKVQTAETTF